VTLFVSLLLAAAATFVIGVAVERDQGHAETSTSQGSVTSAGEAGGHSETGEEGRELSEHSETNRTGAQDSEVGDESVLGIDQESSAAAATAVLISLLLAGVVWRWPVLPTLLVGTAFCLVAAAFDVREVAHQAADGRTGVAVLASLVAVLHLAAAACAAAASAQGWRWIDVAATRGAG
jgi:hypothetical protein